MVDSDKIKEIVHKENENEKLEFKANDIINNGDKLAIEFVALANSFGGQIIIGIENGTKTIKGVEVKQGDEERIMNYAQTLCDPPINPKFEIADIDSKHLYVITIPRFSSIPHAFLEKNRRIYYIRRGSTTRISSSAELSELNRFGGGVIIGEETFSEPDNIQLGFLVLARLFFRNKKDLGRYSKFMKILGYSILAIFFGMLFLTSTLFPNVNIAITSYKYYSYISSLLIGVSLILLGLHYSIQNSFCKHCGNYLGFSYVKTHKIRKLTQGQFIDSFENFYNCKNCNFQEVKTINKVVNPSVDEGIRIYL